jgi:hypothetical protein
MEHERSAVTAQLSYEIIMDFPQQFSLGTGYNKRKSSTQPPSSTTFCSEDNCEKAFETDDSLTDHNSFVNHTDRNLSWRDVVKTSIIHNVTEVRSTLHELGVVAVSEHISDQPQAHSQKGWALPKKRQSKRFTESQLNYVRNVYKEGEKSGKKVSAEKAAKRMQVKFPVSEHLSKSQVASLFSRLSSSKIVVTSSSEEESLLDDKVMSYFYFFKYTFSLPYIMPCFVFVFYRK